MFDKIILFALLGNILIVALMVLGISIYWEFENRKDCKALSIPLYLCED